MMVELSRTSGNMLKMLTLLQLAQLGVQRLINYLTNHVRKRIMAKIVSPTRDQFSFFNALKPEFAQMFQAFSRTQKEVRSYARYMKTSSRRTQLYGVVNAVTGPVDTATSQATRIIEYNTMKGLMASGDISFTEAQNMLSFAEGMTNELRSGYDCVMELSTTMDPLASAADIIDIRPKIDLQVGIEPEGRAKGEFVFENVKFKYPGKIGKGLLLKGINFKVTPGQVVGITGETGCGKSTTLRLIQRFYDVTEGSILLDGRDIREYNPEWLRSQIVIVEQEPRLLPMTIRENLIFGCKTEPTIEEIEKACRSAQIWDALNDKDKFPEFLETRLHQIPSVAGGEKQRICIARAILMDPPVLLLDEATSALDEVSQHKVQEALQELMKGRTTLVVAHRLSTIKDSDKIIGVKDGIVVDEGTHEELLQKKDSEPNVWKSLWKTMQGKDSHDPPVPSLQRTTTTTAGKFAVLRSALTASLPKAKADAMIRLVNDLENGGNSDDDYKDLFEAASHHVSKWSKVRGAVLATKFQTTSKVAPQEAPVLKRQSSVAEETVAKLTKTLSSSSSAPTTVAAQALPQRW
jgi:ABC-type multidrug transport system fused ATPase/permease subunit